MSETKQVTVPTVSAAECVQAAQAAATHAKELFLRGLPAEAAKMAHLAAHYIRAIDTEAHAKLKSLAATFESHVPTAAPAPAPKPAT